MKKIPDVHRTLMKIGKYSEQLALNTDEESDRSIELKLSIEIIDKYLHNKFIMSNRVWSLNCSQINHHERHSNPPVIDPQVLEN